MNVSKIEIRRLFNLGSYEHISYSITVEIPEGESATTAMFGLENIINAINPKRPGNVPDQAQSHRDELNLKEMIEMSEEDFGSRHGTPVGGRVEYLKRIKANIERGILRRTRWNKNQKRARELLDDVGGAVDFRDAKLSWEDDDTEF